MSHVLKTPLSGGAPKHRIRRKSGYPILFIARSGYPFFLLWGKSGYPCLLSEKFRILFFCLWRNQGTIFCSWAASKKGPVGFRRKLQILVLIHELKTALPGGVLECRIKRGGHSPQVYSARSFTSGFRVPLSFRRLLQKGDRSDFGENCKFSY